MSNTICMKLSVSQGGKGIEVGSAAFPGVLVHKAEGGSDKVWLTVTLPQLPDQGDYIWVTLTKGKTLYGFDDEALFLIKPGARTIIMDGEVIDDYVEIYVRVDLSPDNAVDLPVMITGEVHRHLN